MKRGWKSTGIKEIYVFLRGIWLGIKKSEGTKSYCIWLKKKKDRIVDCINLFLCS